MEIKSETSYLRNTRCADVYTESTVDYSLPDYLGDVRKILFTDASIRPSGKFAGGDEVEFTGLVVYNLIYLDSEGNLSSAEFNSDYEYTVKCSGEGYRDSLADTKLSSYTIRLAGPRRVSARASIVGSARVCEEGKICLSGNALKPDLAPEVSTGVALVRESRISSTVEREVAERILELEGAIADEVSVIYSLAEPIIEGVSCEDDSVTVKGRLRVNALVKSEEQAGFGVEKFLPFEEKIDFDHGTSSELINPKVSVSSLKLTVNPTENGCDLVADCVMEICLVAECNQSLELLRDAYLKTASTENSYDDFRYHSLVGSSSAKGTHNAELDRSALESENLREIVLMTATPKVDRVELADGKVNILGEIRYSGIASEQTEDKISYVSIKTSSPFATNVNINCQTHSNMRVNCHATAFDSEIKITENDAMCSCDLILGVSLSSEKRQRCLGASNLTDEEYATDASVVTVYYPDASESLFEIAKRFHTSVSAIAVSNRLSESALASLERPLGAVGVNKLIIK